MTSSEGKPSNIVFPFGLIGNILDSKCHPPKRSKLKFAEHLVAEVKNPISASAVYNDHVNIPGRQAATGVVKSVPLPYEDSSISSPTRNQKLLISGPHCSGPARPKDI